MKLSIKLSALLLIAAFASCGELEPIEPNTPTDGPKVDANGMIAVSINTGTALSTRVTTGVNKDYSLDFGWEQGDKLFFIPSSNATEGTSSTLTVSECTSEQATLTGFAKAGVQNRLIMCPSNTVMSPISYKGKTASLDVSYQNWDMEGMHKTYKSFADAMFMINDDGERDAINEDNVSKVPSVNFAHINACLTLRISFRGQSLGDYADLQYKIKRVILQDMPVKADIDLTKNPGEDGFMTNIESGSMNIEVINSPFAEELSDYGVNGEYWIPVPIFATDDFKKEYELSIVLEREDGDYVRTAYSTVTFTPDYADLVAGSNNAVSVEITRVKESRIGGMLMINEVLCDPNNESEFVDFNDQDFIELMNVSDEAITWEAGQMLMTAYNDGDYTEIPLAAISDGVITDGTDKLSGQTTLKVGGYFVQKGKAGANIIHNTKNLIIVSENIATKSDGSVDANNPLWIPIETLNLSAMEVDDTHTLRYSFGYKTSVKEYIADPDDDANAWGIPEKGCTYGRANTQLGDNIFINEYALEYNWGSVLGDGVLGNTYHEKNNWIELYNSTIDPITLLVKDNNTGVQIHRANGGYTQSDDTYTIESDNQTVSITLPSKGYHKMDHKDEYRLSLDYDYDGYDSSKDVGTELVLLYGAHRVGASTAQLIIDTVPIWDLTTNQSTKKTYTWSFARDLQSRSWYVETSPTMSADNKRDGAALVYTRPADSME